MRRSTKLLRNLPVLIQSTISIIDSSHNFFSFFYPLLLCVHTRMLIFLLPNTFFFVRSYYCTFTHACSYFSYYCALQRIQGLRFKFRFSSRFKVYGSGLGMRVHVAKYGFFYDIVKQSKI